MRIFWLLIFTVISTGCVHHLPIEVAGQRMNSHGEIEQQIFRATKNVEYPTITPDGSNHYTAQSCKYYFQANDKPKRQIFIGDSTTKNFFNPFLAVSNSPLWVTFYDTIIWTNRPTAAHVVSLEGVKSYTSHQVNDLHVYVFDDKGYFLHRTFMILQKGEGKPLPEGQNYIGEFEFENGNQTIIFKSRAGVKKYDVLTDRVTDAE